MSQPNFRIVLPVALIRGRVQYHTGRRDAKILEVLLDAIDESGSSASKLQASLQLPTGAVAALLESATSLGYATIGREGIALSEACLRAKRQGLLSSLFRSQDESVSCEWAVDTSSGLVHDFDWVLANRKSIEGVNDVVLTTELGQEQIVGTVRETPLGELITASSVRSKFNETKEGLPRLTVESVDAIQDLKMEETLEVAIPVSEHHSGEMTRWLLPHNAPRSIVSSLLKRKPELFSIRYALKEAREKWESSQAAILLDRIDDLWEKVQNAILTRTSPEERKAFANIALEEVQNWKASLKNETVPYSDFRMADAWALPPSEQGEEFAKFLKRVTSRVVILTSFLNRKYVEWVSEMLSNLRKNTSVLILYGHANEETPAVQEQEIELYRKELLHYLRNDIKLSVGITTRRSHEKIVVADSSDCLIGSWNICSSNPGSEHLEISAWVKSTSIAAELCAVLAEETMGESATFIRALRRVLAKTSGNQGGELGPRIESLLLLIHEISAAAEGNSIELWREWRTQLLGLRDVLWTYFDSPRSILLTTESLRDAFVGQIRSSNSSILIATDRVNPNGLDASLTMHMFDKNRLIRIIWGMESPHWDLHNLPNDAQEELREAAQTLEPIVKNGRDDVFTSFRPMSNHGKALIVDEDRILVSSCNFLARGREPTEDSSREIGVLIESPLLARKLLGQLMLHSESIRGRVNIRSRVGQPWDLYELIRKSIDELEAQKDIKNPGRADIVRFAVLSNFREFTEDGKIVGDEDGLYRSLDESLSKRWEVCMNFFGKKRTVYPGVVLNSYEERLLDYACEMVGIQRIWKKESYTLHSRSRQTSVLLPEVLRKKYGAGTKGQKILDEEGLEVNEDLEKKSERVYNLNIGRAHQEFENETDSDNPTRA